MTTLYFIPIEPLEERYTGEWYRNFPKYFRGAGFEVKVIDGEVLLDHVDKGTFLDINSTVFYKAEQIKRVAKLFFDGRVSGGDVFFVADLEFWGIEVIRYLADLQGIAVKLYGFLHAASYTNEDFIAPCAPYGKYFELGWAKVCDGVFVGSTYNKNAFLERRVHPYCSNQDKVELSQKFYVVGNPLFSNEYELSVSQEKRDQIILPNRFDWEKRPNLSLDFAYLLKQRHPEWSIIVATSRPEFKSNREWLIEYARGLEKDGVIEIRAGLSKKEYHMILARSRVMLSNTIEENFGYCVIEACRYDTYPLCPNKFAHPELLQGDKRLLFDDEDEIIEKVEFLMNSTFTVAHYCTPFYSSMDSMVKVMFS